MKLDETIHKTLLGGIAIPAHPLALDANLKLDERRQRALSRYYVAAGAGGLAIGVHTTQFAIHEPSVGLYEPVLAIAKEEMDRADASRERPLVRVGGIVGRTKQAVREASTLAELGYHAGLLNLGAMKDAPIDSIVDHCRAVAEVVPVFGFNLNPDVGGCELPFRFWRQFVEIDNVVAIKIAAFNRYQTMDVVRAVAEAGRDDIALYTGNDDNIFIDLLTPFRFVVGDRTVECRIVGGLLGHWAVWTTRAVELLAQCQQSAAADRQGPIELLRTANEVTDMNAAVFDAANRYVGAIPGIMEVLRRQGLLEGIWCLDEKETLSVGQQAEILRVCAAYPHLTDDEFVQNNLDKWLAG